MNAARTAFVASAILALAHPASAEPSTHFETISHELHAIVEDGGAPGAALLIGIGPTIFYVETAGKTTLNSPVNVAARNDLAQMTLLLALVETGFIGIDDKAADYLTLSESDQFAKASVRDLLRARVGDGAQAEDAARALILIAEAATARPWDSLFREWIAAPIGMDRTRYPQRDGLSAALSTRAPTGVVETTARDYARLLSIYVNDGMNEGAEILSKDMLARVFRGETIGAGECARAAGGTCGLVEQSAVGLYAWIDPERGLYGVITAPGAEVSIAKAGAAIRTQAEAIYDREQAAGEGFTAAIRQR